MEGRTVVLAAWLLATAALVTGAAAAGDAAAGDRDDAKQADTESESAAACCLGCRASKHDIDACVLPPLAASIP